MHLIKSSNKHGGQFRLIIGPDLRRVNRIGKSPAKNFSLPYRMSGHFPLPSMRRKTEREGSRAIGNQLTNKGENRYEILSTANGA